MNVLVGLFIAIASSISTYCLMQEKERRDFQRMARQIKELQDRDGDVDNAVKLSVQNSRNIEDFAIRLKELEDKHKHLQDWCYGKVAFLGKDGSR